MSLSEKLLEDLAALPARTVGVARMIRAAENNEPRKGSAGWHERQGEGAYAAASPWGDKPVFEAHSQAILFLAATEDHLLGVSHLLAQDDVALAQLTTCRAALEASGRAWWALDRIALDARICRAMNERRYSMMEQSKMPIPDERISRSLDRAHALVEAAEKLGLPVLRDKTGNTIAIGDRPRPSSTELIESLIGTLGLGETMYRWASGVAHATLYGLMSQLSTVDDEDVESGIKRGIIERSETSIVMTSYVSVAGFIEAFNRIVDLFDWATDHWRDLRQHAEDVARAGLVALGK